MKISLKGYKIQHLRALVKILDLGVKDRSKSGLRKKIQECRVPPDQLKQAIVEMIHGLPTSIHERYLFKVLVLGPKGCGKLTLLERFSTGLISGGTKRAIGVDFSVTTIKTKYGTSTLQLWDFGGEQRFRTMLPSFCLGSSGCFLLSDPTDPSSLTGLDEWFTTVRRNTKNIPIVLLSTKQDLIDQDHPFHHPLEDLRMLMDRHRVSELIPISAVTGSRVKEAFETLTNMMIERNWGLSYIE